MTGLHTRIAPTPSGYLHLGNAFSFLYTYLIVCSSDDTNSSLRLRIDDADTSRSRDEYLEDIFHSLDWLGIHYSKGPSGVEDFKKNYSQQLRFDLYHEYINQLNANSHLIYACDCTRSQIKKASKNGLYPNICRDKKLAFSKANTALRIQVPDQAINFQDIHLGKQTIHLAHCMGDFVVKRKDGLPAYQIASLVDDLYYQSNFIVRGMDLIDSTAAQVFLAKKGAGHQFSKINFYHHPLILESREQKLSKSDHALSLKDLRKRWPHPLPVYQLLAKIIGITTPIGSMNDLIKAFIPSKHRISTNYYLKDLVEY